MLEFIVTMSIIALTFCAATVFVAGIAGAILKIRIALKSKRTA